MHFINAILQNSHCQRALLITYNKVDMYQKPLV